MHPKKRTFIDEEEALESTPLSEAPFEEETRDASQPVKTDPDYEPRSWKNILTIYHCNRCGVDMNSEDDMILHVVKHYPEAEQNGILEKLTKGK